MEVLTEWNRMPTVAPYVKLDITRYLTLISKIREQGFRLTKEEELRAANIPSMKRRSRCGTSSSGSSGSTSRGRHSPAGTARRGHPDPAGAGTLLPKAGPLLLLCQGLRLPGGRGGPHDRREEEAEEINEILLHRLKNNIRFCAVCGRRSPPPPRTAVRGLLPQAAEAVRRALPSPKSTYTAKRPAATSQIAAGPFLKREKRERKESV